MNDLLALAVSLLVSFVAAGIGGYATSRSVRAWYPTLPKPSWTPPGWLFGPVWTVLYLGMAVAAWLVWTARGDRDVTPALLLFGAQLVLNTLWSVVFFGFRAPGAGLVVIVLLWWSIAATIFVFAQHSVVAAAILVPYLLWVTFATMLNGAIVGSTAAARA